jgi:hypothetical protein
LDLELVRYWKEVLGIQAVILPEGEVVQALPKVLFIDEKPWSPKAAALFEKMREAMKLTSEQIDIQFESVSSAADIQMHALTFNAVVFFSPKNIDKIEVGAKFQTDGPEMLLADPQLKKSAWSVLQQVMKSLQS